MKIFSISVIIIFSIHTFGENSNTKKRKINSELPESAIINYITIDSDQSYSDLSSDFKEKKTKKIFKSLSNNQFINSILTLSDLSENLSLWSAYDRDQLILRSHYFKLDQLVKLYPQLDPKKLLKLKTIVENNEK